jgi:glycerol-3-phosphate acyltransferase PlsY
MDILYLVTIFIITYLIGSVSFARIVTRIWTRGQKDVTQFEKVVPETGERYKVMNVGAETVSSELGSGAGMTVSLLDMIKIIIPTLVCRLLFPNQPVFMITAALGGLIGHIWPIYYRFHGGQGFSAIIGGLLVIDPLAVLVAPLSGLFLGIVVLRNMIIAATGWVWLLIPWLWWRFHGDPLYIIYAVIINIIFVIGMLPYIKKVRQAMKEGRSIGHLESSPMGRGLLKMREYMKRKTGW